MVAKGWKKLTVLAWVVCSALEPGVGNGRVITPNHMGRMGVRESPPCKTGVVFAPGEQNTGGHGQQPPRWPPTIPPLDIRAHVQTPPTLN